MTIEFFNGYAAGEPHTVLYPIHKNRTTVALKWRADMTAAVSTTNPELRGNVQLLTYNPSVTRGEEDAWSAEFVAADSAGLAYVTAP